MTRRGGAAAGTTSDGMPLIDMSTVPGPLKVSATSRAVSPESIVARHWPPTP